MMNLEAWIERTDRMQVIKLSNNIVFEKRLPKHKPKIPVAYT